MKQFRESINALMKKRMGPKFYGLWAFCPTLRPELKGTGNDTSWVTSIDSFIVPSQETGNDLFLAANDDVKTLIESTFDEHEDFGQMRKGDTEPEETVTPAPVPTPMPVNNGQGAVVPMDDMMADIPF